MIFNSSAFLVYFVSVFFLYWFVFNKTIKLQNFFILAVSYFFYGWWDWRFLGLLMLSTLIDYFFAFPIAEGSHRKRKLFLVLSLINNLLVLGIFKYYNFFVTEAQHLGSTLGFHFNPYILNIALPLGISFYTFHGMSYVIDIYRGDFKPVKSFVDYAVFVCFFPLLVSGPIERAGHLVPQVQSQRKFDYTQGVQGLRLMLWGLFKKMVIADSLAPNVDVIFGKYTECTGSTLVLGAFYFAIQIYCDFSGYTDIAIGTAKLLGFELLSNFQYPYGSQSISEFWKRWHMSLSTWFYDYLFNPMVIALRDWGNRAVAFGVIITFLVSGLWHGAAWHFIGWGLWYGIALAYEALTRKARRKLFKKLPAKLGSFISWGITFSYVCLGYILFRARTLHIAFDYMRRIPHNLFTKPTLGSFMFIYVLPFLILDWYFRKDGRILSFPKNIVVRYSFYMLLFFAILNHSNDNSGFIYFQF